MYASEIAKLRKAFKSGKTRSVEWRKKQLTALQNMLIENRDVLCDAVWKDLHKNPAETELMEIIQVKNEITTMFDTIDENSKPKKCSKSALAALNKVCVRKEPYGVCLILGAWNYPLLLSVQPMVGAIAAGNCVILKLSEVSVNSAAILQELIPQYLDNDCFSIVTCGPKESGDLINNHRFDMIFYTGGTHVGRLVMQAAAKNLTPVVLELGGKNPCYVDKSCDLDATARRMSWGKWTNAGQICIAPDFVLCEAEIQDKLIEKLKETIEEYYGEDPRKSESYGRIVAERHVKRLEGLLTGVDVVYGGVIDEKERYMSPTIVVNVKSDAPIRGEEIFGPILPIITVKNLEHAIEIMNTGEKSLQLSIFAQDRSVIDRVVAETSSGGVTVNEMLMQNNELDLPFGGVGCSGMGLYHGSYTYDSFCHMRGYYEGCTPEVINNIRYPPYTSKKTSVVRLAANVIRPSPVVRSLFKLIILAALGVLISYIYNLIR